MSDLTRNIFRLIAFIFVQVYVLNKIPHLHRFITPYIYFLFILWVPFSTSRIGLLFIGFFTGLILDYFMMTPGLHAAACLLTAYVRPFIINLLTPKEASGVYLQGTFSQGHAVVTLPVLCFYSYPAPPRLHDFSRMAQRWQFFASIDKNCGYYRHQYVTHNYCRAGFS